MVFVICRWWRWEWEAH